VVHQVQVRWIAESLFRRAIKSHPKALEILLNPYRFKPWCRITSEELSKSPLEMDQEALVRKVEELATVYARACLNFIKPPASA